MYSLVTSTHSFQTIFTVELDRVQQAVMTVIISDVNVAYTYNVSVCVTSFSKMPPLHQPVMS